MENLYLIIAVIAGLLIGYIFGKKSISSDTTQQDARILELSAQITLLTNHNADLQSKLTEQSTLEATLKPLQRFAAACERNKHNSRKS